MSVRENLLRLRRWRLQERQGYLAGLESLLARLRGDVRRLKDEAEDLRSPAAGTVLVRPLIERQRKIEGSIAEVERQIDDARAAADSALQELKLCEGAIGAHAASAPAPATPRLRRERHGAFPGIPPRGNRSRSV